MQERLSNGEIMIMIDTLHLHLKDGVGSGTNNNDNLWTLSSLMVNRSSIEPATSDKLSTTFRMEVEKLDLRWKCESGSMDRCELRHNVKFREVQRSVHLDKTKFTITLVKITLNWDHLGEQSCWLRFLEWAPVLIFTIGGMPRFSLL